MITHLANFFFPSISLEVCFVIVWNGVSLGSPTACCVKSTLILNEHQSSCLYLPNAGITTTPTLEISWLFPEFCLNFRISLIGFKKIPKRYLLESQQLTTEFRERRYLCKNVCSWHWPSIYGCSFIWISSRRWLHVFVVFVPLYFMGFNWKNF